MYAGLLRTVAGILAILTTTWIIILLVNASMLGFQSAASASVYVSCFWY